MASSRATGPGTLNASISAFDHALRQRLAVGDTDDETSLTTRHPREEIAEGDPNGGRDLLHRADRR